MESLYFLLALPLIIGLISKLLLKDKYPLQIVIFTIAISSVISALLWGISRHSLTTDTEIWNGKITSKTRDKVQCRHSYSCNCVTSCSGSGSNQSCTTICQTCYDHAFDIDWNLHSTIGSIRIDTIDRQGLREPPRWTKAMIGDPAAKTMQFTNYVKAVPESLFHQDKSSSLEKIPKYPDDVYDYHYVNRAIPIGVKIPDIKEWNHDIAMALRDLGPTRQVNFIVVFTKNPSASFANTINQKWVGGKKNDVIVVIGTPNHPEISWVRILSWTDRQDFKVALRDAIFDMGTIDRKKIIDVMVSETKSKFVRKRMRDFEYLKNEIHPPMWAIVLGIIISIIITSGIPVLIAIERWKSNQRRKQLYGRNFN